MYPSKQILFYCRLRVHMLKLGQFCLNHIRWCARAMAIKCYSWHHCCNVK